MKKKVKVEVVNADWEIRKFKIKKELSKISEVSGNGLKFCAKAFFSGAGFAAVFILRSKLRDF